MIRNHWTILFDLSYSMHHPLRNDPEKTHCAPARFLDKIIPGVHFALASMPCKVWQNRNDNTGLTSCLLPFTNSPLLTLFLSFYPVYNEVYKIIWGVARLFDLTYPNYYVERDPLFHLNYWPTHTFKKQLSNNFWSIHGKYHLVYRVCYSAVHLKWTFFPAPNNNRTIDS